MRENFNILDVLLESEILALKIELLLSKLCFSKPLFVIVIVCG